MDFPARQHQPILRPDNDSSPTNFLIRNIFTAAKEWPPSNPDLNQLDYSLWTELELKACHKSHQNLDYLKRALTKEANRIPVEKIPAATQGWQERLRVLLVLCYFLCTVVVG